MCISRPRHENWYYLPKNVSTMQEQHTDPRADKSILDMENREERFEGNDDKKKSFLDVPADEHITNEGIPKGQEEDISQEHEENRDINDIVTKE